MSAVPVILASGSAVRRMILTNAGVAFEAVSPDVDEDALKREFAGLPPVDLALALAERKALSVPAGDALVIGADQVLELDGEALDKVAGMAAARARLAAMRGRTHALCGGLALVRGGEIVWRHREVSRLAVREFSDDFLDVYLAAAGAQILASVACYQFEGLGAQLFEKIEGDYFAILGLSLVPLLAALRAEGALQS